MSARGRWSRWRPRSVRARTTAVATLVVGVALAAGAVGLLLTLEYSLTRSGDTAAVTRVRDLATLARTGSLPRTVPAPSEEDVVQVVGRSGRVHTASPNAVDAPPITTARQGGQTPTVRTVRAAVDGDEPEAFRVWSMRAQTPRGTVFVHVGSSLEQVAETTGVLRLSLLAGVPVLTALLGFSTWVLLGRALRPVETIRAEVADISQQALHRRVPVPGTSDEVSRLAVTMNAMLARLDASSRRQREFVADASHELQSPLASFRAQLEVARAHPDSADWDATAAGLLADSDRMERLVRDLLYLARADAVPAEAPRTLVDLDDVVLEEAERVRGRGVPVDTSQVSAAPVRGAGEDLRRMVRNLLDNALRHAEHRVRVTLDGSGDTVVLAVEDDGRGIAEPDRERIFERFVRLDDSRPHGRSGGTGLGLAIVRSIAERHRGTARAEASPDGARLVVRLPVAR